MQNQEKRWLEEFFEAVNQFTCIIDVQGRIIRINRTALEITGADISDVVGLYLWEIPWPSLSKKNRLNLKRAIHRAASGEIVWDELEIKGRVSHHAVINFSIKPISDEAGALQFMIVEARDVTIHSRTRAALQESEKRFKSTFVELNELQRRIMHGRELERLRVAQNLHDGPLQEIISVTYQLKALENSLTDPVEVERLRSVLHTLHQLARSLRTVCTELRPPTLIPFGLKKAILSHAEEFSSAHPGIEINLDLDFDGQILPEQIRLVFYRIYQEAMNNILRHAQAKAVWVHFHMSDQLAHLEIRDNGIGFKIPDKWILFARQGHLGLVGVMERVREIGGNIEIAAAPGKGTRIWTGIHIQEPVNIS